jgi:type IV secretion system protein VirD4
MWRGVLPVLILFLCAASSFAQVPQANTVPDNAAQGGLSTADYNRDVAQAIGIQYRLRELTARYNNKQIDPATYQATSKVLGDEYARLYSKWQAVGKGADLERDYKQHLAAMPMPARKFPVQGKATGKGSQFQSDSPQRAKVPAAAQPSQAVFFVRRVFFAVIVGFIVLCLFYLIRFLRRKPEGRRVSDIYGTARYAPQQLDIANESCLANGVFFGKSSAPRLKGTKLEHAGAPICSTPEHHTLIVARTRTGKGTRVIIPTLLRYGGSVFVIDPKGENAAITARARSEMVPQQGVRILNPWNELSETFQSQGVGELATYNPLDILDRSDPNAVAVAQTLAAAICPAPANAKDRFWQGSAANVLTAVFLWLAENPEERKTLARAREIVSLSRKEFTTTYLVPMAASEAFSGAIREMAAPYIDLAPETYSGVMSNLSENTRFLSDPQVKTSTAKSSFSMDDLVTQKTTVYVVIPTERMETQKTWLRLVVAAAMHAFKRPKKRRESGHRCLFLIDEFAGLGHMDDMPRDIATMGGFGVDFALVVQGLNQLKDHYGDARNTIVSNCAYQWFCNLNDLDSGKYLSEVLGKKTVVTQSTSHSTSSGTRSSSDSDTTTQGETGRNLLNPDELLNLGKNWAILIQPNGHPHLLRPVDYWNLPKAFDSLRRKHRSLYWEPPLSYDKNPFVDEPPPLPPAPWWKMRWIFSG